METHRIIPWLDDAALSQQADHGAADPSMWGERYDPACPSEFYRGYATLLVRISDACGHDTDPAALGRLIDAFNREIKALPADELRNGAGFALMNVASHAEGGTMPQMKATLAAEVPCIARCFVHNHSRGL
jgi:hypothetical protein